MSSVIVLRSASAGSLRDHRLKTKKLIFVEPTRFQSRRVSIPRKTYDFLLLTSFRSVHASRLVPAKRVVCIGPTTRGEFVRKYGTSEKIISLSGSSSKAVIAFFKKWRNTNKSIFFPRSALADPELVHRLRSLGLKVCVRHTYTMKSIGIRPAIKMALKQKPQAIFFASPSGVASLLRSFSKSEIESWGLKMMCIGPTTKAYFRKRFGY